MFSLHTAGALAAALCVFAGCSRPAVVSGPSAPANVTTWPNVTAPNVTATAPNATAPNTTFPFSPNVTIVPPDPTSPLPPGGPSGRYDAPLFRDVVVPLVSALLGGFVVLLVGLLIASRSGWIRRAARWGPYGKELFNGRFQLLRDLLAESHAGLTAMEVQAGAEADPDASIPIETPQRLRQHRDNLLRLLSGAHLLLGEETVTATRMMRAALTPGASLATAQRRYWALVDAARAEMDLDPLRERG